MIRESIVYHFKIPFPLSVQRCYSTAHVSFQFFFFSKEDLSNNKDMLKLENWPHDPLF